MPRHAYSKQTNNNDDTKQKPSRIRSLQVKETVSEIARSCRADLAHFPDPTVQLQLALQLAITGERYSEASR